MSKLNLFKPEDYEVPDRIIKNTGLRKDEIRILKGLLQHEFADVANKILNDYIETLPKVSGSIREGFPDVWCSKENYPVPDTHTARLICIEEIKPKECEHEPADVTCDIPRGSPLDHTVVFKWGVAKCKYCNKTLKPNWSVE